MNKADAHRYLAALVAELLTESVVDVETFTGADEGYHHRKLIAALRSAGCNDAAEIVQANLDRILKKKEEQP